MDAPQPTIPDLDQLERQLTDASAEHDDGRRYVRAAVACAITGFSDAHLRYWRRRGWVDGLRFRVPPCRQAPNGRVAVYELASLVRRTRRYWSGTRRWTGRDDDYLLTHLGLRPLDRIAAKMGRSVEAVRLRAQALGVSQLTAQGELTTVQVARLCGVYLAAVHRWCHRRGGPLRYRRLPDKAGSRMIAVDDLRRFFVENPHLYHNRTEAARQRIDRVTMTTHQARKAVAA